MLLHLRPKPPCLKGQEAGARVPRCSREDAMTELAAESRPHEHLGFVGFIGLGIMGAPMVRNLVGAGFAVVAWNRSPERLEAAVADGAERGASPADVASRAE